MGGVTGGEVGAGDEGEAEGEGEAGGGGGGVSGPELDVVEGVDREAVRPGVRPDEFLELLAQDLSFPSEDIRSPCTS